ncbi:hypothetical protein A1Q2_03744 [Trichosporon asahii var. asahii CBS 8904]|uniref:Uncharacterized protein n=1 Tax=Trichosporon asahii var. asahii (strain CBS 8904) TaxID=1220162 RepID=K1WLD1_TRIAC|nr:hypothetical protein A1Q2_03744 [Trichosporon asahii var. asahii CBS 8904]
MGDAKIIACRARVLDCNMFPQIIDTIIEYASNASLQAMRVNKGFRAFIDSHLAYHLVVSKLRREDGGPLNRYEVSSSRGVVGQITFTAETATVLAASYFRSARVLDISIAAKWPSMMPALVRACPDAAFRFKLHTDLRHLNFSNATVVLLGEDKPVSVAGYLAYGIDEVRGVDTLVVHIRAPGRRDDMFDLNVKHLVLVLHPWPVSDNFATWFAERLSSFHKSVGIERHCSRYLDCCQVALDDACACANATVVLLGEDKPVSVAGYLAYGIDEVRGVDTLVVHIRAPGRRDDMFDLNVKHLVLVLHPWPVSDNFATWFAERLSSFHKSVGIERHFHIVEAVIRDQLGVFWDLLWAGFVNRIPVTVISVESEPHPRIAEYKEFDLGVSIREVLTLRRSNLGLPEDSPLPRFFNHDEYKHEVGNETYQIHMNNGFIDRPHNTLVKFRE